MQVRPVQSKLLLAPVQKPRCVCCIGAGFVGGPTAAVIAYQNPDVRVLVVDVDSTRINSWRSGIPPFHEPGLHGIVRKTADVKNADPDSSRNLEFSTDIKGAIAASDIIFLCVNTPTKTFGRGSGSASNLVYTEAACRDIAEASLSDKIIVEKSTVPVRTAEALRSLLNLAGRPGVKFEVLSNPEFLAEGTAVQDLMDPDRVLIGFMSTTAGRQAAKTLRSLYAWIPDGSIFYTDVWSSELAKLASNAFLAQRISSINSLSAICEATGAQIEDVAQIVGMDTRIGAKMLRSGIGFGGSCFKKDILNLCYLAESLNLPQVSEYWKSVLEINDWQKERFVRKLSKRLNETLSNKTIGVLGFAYKKDTSDARESPAIYTVQSLITEGAAVRIYDPEVTKDSIVAELVRAGVRESDIARQVRFCDSALDAGRSANAVVVLTEWSEFADKDAKPLWMPTADIGVATPDSSDDGDSNNARLGPLNEFDGRWLWTETYGKAPRGSLEWEKMASSMVSPRYVLDGRNVVDPVKLQSMGMLVECIGGTR